MLKLSSQYFLSTLLSFLIIVFTPIVSATVEKNDDQNQQITLQLRWYHQYQFAGYYVAKELGYYDEVGIDALIVEGAPGIDPVKQVTKGRADFGVDNSGLVWARSQGMRVKAVAAIFQKSAMRFITKGSDKYTPKDMSGKSVMLLPDFGSLALIALLKQEGLLNQIQRINSSHNIQDLINDKIFAFNGYASNEPFALEASNLNYRLIDPADYGIRFYSDVLFTSDRLSEGNPKLVDAFKAASVKGWKYALDYPEETVNIVRKYAPHKSRSHLRFEANIVRQHMVADFVDIGNMSNDRWADIQRHLVAIELIQPENTIMVDSLLHKPYKKPNSWKDHLEYFAALSFLIVMLTIALWVYRQRAKSLEQEVIKTKESEAKLFIAATHDSLTELPNRLLFMDRLEVVLDDLRRTGLHCAIAFIDLDNFKCVNDSYGHHKGDELLRLTAQRLKNEIRASSTIARYGGDEFVFLGRNIDESEAASLSLRLIDAVKEASNELKIEPQVTATIGIVLVKSMEGLNAQRVISIADKLMYDRKATGKGGFTIDVVNNPLNRNRLDVAE
ncbi:ABC transporter substrate-binding protein [Neptuniibacter sp. QD37_11]|uniref:GGDEF domain-containing protein n=1 Tax=Neptuniibacter sp. QD37_11 TaxID=3398209 RepID=UPI0039F620D0